MLDNVLFNIFNSHLTGCGFKVNDYLCFQCFEGVCTHQIKVSKLENSFFFVFSMNMSSALM